MITLSRMRQIRLTIGCAIALLTLTTNQPCSAQETSNDFGATPPGKTAEPFAPEFFATLGEGHRFGLAITDDGRERYYAVGFVQDDQFREEIRYTRYENGTWTPPKPLLDENSFKYVDPHLSPDGKRMYFIYTKPAPGTTAPEQPVFDIWYVDRQADGWSDPINIGSPISTSQAHEFFVSLTSDHTIYFGSNQADASNFDLYSARINEDGTYQKPQPLKGEVNTARYEADVFVAPDESYLIYNSNRPNDSFGRGDLYISFRRADGTWREGINMGEQINSNTNDFAPSVSRDGKYLYYSRGGVIYWVSTAVIEDLRPSNNE